MSLVTLAWSWWGGLATPARACTCVYEDLPTGYLVFPSEEVAVATDVALFWWEFGPTG